MRSLRCLAVFAACLLAQGAAAQTKTGLQPKRTVIAGEVLNPEASKASAMRINFCDPFRNETGFAFLKETGYRFHQEYDYLFAQDMTIDFGGHFINVFINPGDSVYMKIDASKIGRPDAVAFTGDNAEFNAGLNKWRAEGFRDYVYVEMRRGQTVEEFRQAMREAVAANMKVLDGYRDREGMDDGLYEWAATDILFHVANEIVGFWYSGQDAPLSADELISLCEDPVFDIRRPGNTKTMMFRYHASHYAGNLLRKEMEGNGAEQAGAIGKVTEKLRQKGFDDGMTDYIMCVLIAGQMEYHDDKREFYNSLVADGAMFGEQVFDDILKGVAFMAETQWEIVPADGLYLNKDGRPEEVGTDDFIAYLGTKYPDKVIYLDVWAVWCGPCLSQMISHSPVLVDHYRGKDVVFVNVCMRSDPGKWADLALRMNADTENFLFGEQAGMRFNAGYGVKGFPTYMVIGRDGKVVSSNAPPPSSFRAATGMLDSLLGE